MRYREILQALKGDGRAWSQTYQMQSKRIFEILNLDLLCAADICAGSERPLPDNLNDLQERIRSVERRVVLPSHIRDEALEFGQACVLYNSPKRVNELGRTCAYCWRTDDGRFPMSAELYSQCHVHEYIKNPGPSAFSGDPIKDRELHQQLQDGKEARRAVDYSRKLLDFFTGDDPFFYLRTESKLFAYPSNKNMTPDPKHPRGVYPKYHQGRNATRDSYWLPWLKQEFPLVVTSVRKVGKAHVLYDPLETISFLERRSLLWWEKEFYSNPLSWAFPVAKCSAWLNLERLRYRETMEHWRKMGKRNREPELNYEHLLLAGRFLSLNRV